MLHFQVQKPNGGTRHFVALNDGGGLYYTDTNYQTENNNQKKSCKHGRFLDSTAK
jgi:hypothetical protein